MGRRAAEFILSPADRLRLEKVVDRGENWRERQRAQTLVLLDNGTPRAEIAASLGIDVRTVGSTRSAWLCEGMSSLPDRPRSGAPWKVTPQQWDKLVELASSEPLTARSLLAKHLDSGGTAVHLNTIKARLKGLGFVWKRTRHSLKKKE
jgi:transposase